MHALCAHAQGSVDLHVESYGVAGPLVETLCGISKQAARFTIYLLAVVRSPCLDAAVGVKRVCVEWHAKAKRQDTGTTGTDV